MSSFLAAFLLLAGVARADDASAYKERAFAAKTFGGKDLKGMSVRDAKAAGRLVWTPGDQQAYEYALECRRIFASKVAPDWPYLVLANFSLQGEAPRLRVFNVSNPEDPAILMETHVGHGQGNIVPGTKGWDFRYPPASVMSDRDSSSAVAAGCLRVYGAGGRVFPGEENADLYGWHLEGLEERNKCAFPRGQKLHQQGSDRVNDETGMMKPSHGCMNLSNDGYKRLWLMCLDPEKRETCVINPKGVILASYVVVDGGRSLPIVPSRTSARELAAACRADRSDTEVTIEGRKRPYPRKTGDAMTDFGGNVEVKKP